MDHAKETEDIIKYVFVIFSLILGVYADEPTFNIVWFVNERFRKSSVKLEQQRKLSVPDCKLFLKAI